MCFGDAKERDTTCLWTIIKLFTERVAFELYLKEWMNFSIKDVLGDRNCR